MMKNFSLVLFLVVACFSFGQKELTLDDAVMQQYRAFLPEQPMMLQWIPGTSDYSYLKGYVNLMRSSATGKEEKQILTIQELNAALNAELYWFSGFEWKNANEFWVNDGKKYYSYNLATKKGTALHNMELAENALFSKSKQHVAYTMDNNVYISRGDISLQGSREKHVTVTNNTDKNIVSGQAIARSEFGITVGLFWSNDGNKLAFYQKDETFVADYPLLDVTKTPGALMSIKYPMAGQQSERPKVGIFSMETRTTVYISPKGGMDDYLTNLTFTPDNKYVVIAEVNRDQNHMWLNVYDATTGAFVKTLLEEQSDKWIEPEHPAFFPIATSNNFIWISEKDGFNNLYYYDFDGKLIKQLTANKFVTKSILEYNLGKVYFEATGENPLNTLVYAVDLKGFQTLVTKVEGTHTVAISEDGKYIYDGYSNHSTPFIGEIWSSKGKLTKSIVKASNPLTEYKYGRADIGSITGKDGSKLYTRMILPSNFDPHKKYPVLVYVYGGPHAQMITNSWLDGASLWMYWLAEQGYIVFTLDNRGSGERGVAFETQIHRQLGTVEMEDQLAGVEYLKSLKYVDGNRLAVHGWSFGGFMTTSLMLRQPGTFNVGVAGGPVTDWKYYEIMYGERYMDRPEQNEKGYEQSSLMTHANNLKGELLLIHGTVDDVVVMQHNLALVQKFVELGKQMDFFPYPMHKHNVGGKDRVHLMRKVLDFVIENNK